MKEHDRLLRVFNRMHRTAFLERFENVNLVAIIDESDPDGGYRGTSSTHLDARRCWNEIVDGRYPVAVCTVETVGHLIQAVNDNMGDWCIATMTSDQFEKEERERERRRLEGLAAQLAASYGCNPTTLDFLQAVRKEKCKLRSRRDDWRNQEARMERWGACYAELGSARGSEVFFEDGDFEEGRFENRLRDLEDIERWLACNCPLLWALWGEYLHTEGEDEDTNDTID